MASSAELRRRFVDELWREGAITRPEVAEAFAAVPREAFVGAGFHGRDGTWFAPDAEGFLDAVYTNDVLVTKIEAGRATSSSSQPSLMATMIEALDLTPGARVLEIGAGTGYNAALMSAAGAQVTTVDVQPDVVARAATALATLSSTVDLKLGDGYAGWPAGAPYDRVIVTVGVAGAAPPWLDQLAPGGFVVAPTRHAGHHPVLRVARAPDGTVRATGVCPAGFMSAAGPLSAMFPGAHPLGDGPLPPATVRRPARFDPPLDVFRYHDMWFALGAWDPRTTYAQPPDSSGNGGCALLDEAAEGGATVWPDGSIDGSGPSAGAYAERATALIDRWVASGRPAVPAWQASMALDGDPAYPIWVPRDWHRAPAR
ncbi:methyltransferase domain-containing protein [Phytohabitans sp. ZYX-F-186]|uniref:Protein-L-isoaspartate O-methyltransferase n=1 Tax=Phytohabitans maris TaxID=3071409 RepID=A0ABU0ZCS3_9ACTN|nr:methyltransferase domain-containing protein [Phytohabitans sp. ZYX-F-186]MDQ7904142.1 methyltransferase domain-containing protein [Phytohabitans sp. ZYX-F-186]